SNAVQAVKSMGIDLDSITKAIGEKLNNPSLVGEFKINGIFTEYAVNVLESASTKLISEIRSSSHDILVEILMQTDQQVDEVISPYGIDASSYLEATINLDIKNHSTKAVKGINYCYDEFSFASEIALTLAYRDFKKQKYDLILPEHLLLGLLQLPDSKISRFLKEKGITIDDINEFLDNDEES
ncbi:hypothetical protein KAU08_09520, partial [bacterium]|nr:hypothetical protein [bacterium]